MSTNVNEDRKRLKELITEASNLERELKKQEQERRKFNSNPESSAEFEEDTEFLRNSLKDIYEDLLLIDIKFSNEHNIEEKLWHHVFYSHIEELRQKLRRINKNERTNEYEAAYLELCRYLDLGTGFYHTIVNNLKIRENIDLDRVGIEIFRNSIPTASRNAPKLRKKELSAECIQRCLIHLGDFARYREMIYETNDRRWEFSRQFYAKAARVHCDNGKAQAQLALLSALRDNDIDVVYWYCFSLATKQPPNKSVDNLKVFYTKFAQRIPLSDFSVNDTQDIDSFIKRFLVIHRYLFEEDVDSLQKYIISPEESIVMFESLLTSRIDITRSLGVILKKIIFIIIFTVWNLRNGSTQNRNTELRSLSIGLAFSLLVPIMKNMCMIWTVEDQVDDGLGSVVLECLAAISLWCQYLGTLTELLPQLYIHAKSVEKENKIIFQMFLKNLNNFFGSLADILNHPKISLLNVNSAELSRKSIYEDIEFLGVVPLRVLHQDMTFTSEADPLRVRVTRMFVFGKRMAELKQFDMFIYNETTGQYALIDEETKKKERQKVMKLMAQQLLQDQVNSLETNLQKRGLPLQRKDNRNSLTASSKNTVVFDIGVILNHLNSVKKWVVDGKCYVIVPLDVIDSLDLIKKGSAQENARAREAIRYLDLQFQKRHQQNPVEHFIRAQKVDEKLPQWASAEKYLDEKSLPESIEYDGHDEGKEDMEKFSVDNVPQEYRPVLSCWLYYFRLSDIENTFFVTEDMELKKYAKMFGLPVIDVKDI
ncbi:1630_t:CDS:10 [Acaulospora morrowiae]|uniref:1630_t:CDS:1 n=1 Tax=Acaulospora morrowiae TaxID=94023 RepID=A0A9N9FPB2_9GLOM|nr:1630_t:CDS:10 [Acaulospora morrowiae]